MTARTTTERILDAYLAPEADRLPDRVIDAALADIARTPQRRALRVPWRFLQMPALNRATGILAVALVAVVGAGGLILLNSKVPGVPGGQATPIPTATPAVTSYPGIESFTPYTSPRYGTTYGYPNGWRVDGPDSFVNPASRDGDDIGMGMRQEAAGSGANLTTREGLAAWFREQVCDDEIEACETVPDVALPMCVGKQPCVPAILVPLSDSVQAVFAGPEADTVVVVALGRPDDFPATARYGGGVQLLKSFLTQFDVWTPEPGQVPEGT